MATASRYEELIVTETGLARHDFKFRDQIRDASSSGPRNIAEGFGRFNPGEFAHFLEIAKGSLMETHLHARDGCERGYFSEKQRERLCRLAGRTIKAAIPLIRYLKSRAAKEKAARTRRASRNRQEAERTQELEGT